MTIANRPREEVSIFGDLAEICARPGFIHAVAAFCMRDNVWGFDGRLKAEDVLRRRGRELIRSEISTLAGLMLKGSLDQTFPGPAAIQEMMDGAERLLEELHQSMIVPMHESIANAVKTGDREHNPLANAAVVPIDA